MRNMFQDRTPSTNQRSMRNLFADQTPVSKSKSRNRDTNDRNTPLFLQQNVIEEEPKEQTPKMYSRQ